jgi:hypothetical protein
MLRSDPLDLHLKADREYELQHGDEPPWPTAVETAAERLERLAARLGVLDELQQAERLQDIPKKLKDHREGAELVRKIATMRGGLSWQLSEIRPLCIRCQFLLKPSASV